MEKRNSRSIATRTPFEPIVTPSFPSLLIFDLRRTFASRTRPRRVSKAASRFMRFDFGVSILVLLLAGCGAPGDPTAPSPPVPAAITDLSARQAGDGVQLTFTMPSKTIHGERLVETPSIEVLRGTARPDGSPDVPSFRVVDTIPGAVAGRYLSEDHIQIISPVAPDEVRGQPGRALLYRVRTRVSKKRASLDSNAVRVLVFPAPERIASIQDNVTQSSIDLQWSAVTRTSGGDPIAVSEYRIYRGELDARAHDPATKDVLHEKWIAPPAQVGRSDSPDYRDAQFDFGRTYVYIVRSVTTAEGSPLESSDSEPLVLVPIDTFAPATPQGVFAAVLTNPNGAPTEVDLSWSLNAEPDLAGYRVYRSEQKDDKGRLVTPDLLLSPAYRDTSVALGHHYWYRVTAVDRSGNESVPGEPVVADITQHSS
jgi:hypothetical protein